MPNRWAHNSRRAQTVALAAVMFAPSVTATKIAGYLTKEQMKLEVPKHNPKTLDNGIVDSFSTACAYYGEPGCGTYNGPDPYDMTSYDFSNGGCIQGAGYGAGHCDMRPCIQTSLNGTPVTPDFIWATASGNAGGQIGDNVCDKPAVFDYSENPFKYDNGYNLANPTPTPSCCNYRYEEVTWYGMEGGDCDTTLDACPAQPIFFPGGTDGFTPPDEFIFKINLFDKASDGWQNDAGAYSYVTFSQGVYSTSVTLPDYFSDSTVYFTRDYVDFPIAPGTVTVTSVACDTSDDCYSFENGYELIDQLGNSMFKVNSAEIGDYEGEFPTATGGALCINCDYTVTAGECSEQLSCQSPPTDPPTEPPTGDSSGAALVIQGNTFTGATTAIHISLGTN